MNVNAEGCGLSAMCIRLMSVWKVESKRVDEDRVYGQYYPAPIVVDQKPYAYGCDLHWSGIGWLWVWGPCRTNRHHRYPERWVGLDSGAKSV